jgi:hypothetical protein
MVVNCTSGGRIRDLLAIPWILTKLLLHSNAVGLVEGVGEGRTLYGKLSLRCMVFTNWFVCRYSLWWMLWMRKTSYDVKPGVLGTKLV